VLNVVCFFWRDEQRAQIRSAVPTPQEVRIWDSMIARNLTVPHRRICVTHRPDLLEHFIECIPIDPAKHVPGTCLVKLQAHKPGGVAKEGERVLLMDIDCVVTGNLDHLVKHDDEFIGWRNPNYEPGGRRGFFQGSMQLFTVGTTSFLWSEFDPRATMAWLNRRFGGAEQCWISERLNAAYPDAGWIWTRPCWTEADGVYGRGRLFGDKMDKGVQTVLPDNARIVFTPGNRSPGQPGFMEENPWAVEHYR
jgi:hypothetical protein